MAAPTANIERAVQQPLPQMSSIRFRAATTRSSARAPRLLAASLQTRSHAQPPAVIRQILRRTSSGPLSSVAARQALPLRHRGPRVTTSQPGVSVAFAAPAALSNGSTNYYTGNSAFSYLPSIEADLDPSASPAPSRQLPRAVDGPADNPQLANPLERHTRLGTGWMGVIVEYEGVVRIPACPCWEMHMSQYVHHACCGRSHSSRMRLQPGATPLFCSISCELQNTCIMCRAPLRVPLAGADAPCLYARLSLRTSKGQCLGFRLSPPSRCCPPEQAVDDCSDLHTKAWQQLAQEEGKPQPLHWALKRAEGMKNEQVCRNCLRSQLPHLFPSTIFHQRKQIVFVKLKSGVDCKSSFAVLQLGHNTSYGRA